MENENGAGVPMSDEVFAEMQAKWAMLTIELGPEWRRRRRMSLEAFTAFLATFPTMAAELMPVRRNKGTGKIEILFIPRPANDRTTEYAGRLHTPGAMVMPWLNFKAAFEAVMERELGSEDYELIVELPASEGNYSPRGFEVPIPRLVRLLTPVPPECKGEWVAIDALAELYADDAIIRAQYESFIERAGRWLEANEQLITWN